ncbi:MAG: type II secretion system F family protein, partial [Planctomycetota bacterium]
MVEALLPILVFVAIGALGSAIVAGVRSRRLSIQPRLRAVNDTLTADVGGDPWVERSVRQIGETASRGRFTDKLKEQLARAGYHDSTAAATYVGIKILLFVFGVTSVAAGLVWTDLSTSIMIYCAAVGGVFFFFVPNVVVASRRSTRSAEVRRHLPDAVDLLEICVSSGMGLDMAWNSVSDEVRPVSHMLADEMALTTLEIQLGAPRAEAMRNMAGRTGADELASLVALLVQSDRFGTSVADALKTFAESMRESRSQRAEEAAEKMPVKLLFPMTLLIFPVMFVVTTGPA